MYHNERRKLIYICIHMFHILIALSWIWNIKLMTGFLLLLSKTQYWFLGLSCSAFWNVLYALVDQVCSYSRTLIMGADILFRISVMCTGMLRMIASPQMLTPRQACVIILDELVLLASFLSANWAHLSLMEAHLPPLSPSSVWGHTRHICCCSIYVKFGIATRCRDLNM